jgi:hypothetical protein
VPAAQRRRRRSPRAARPIFTEPLPTNDYRAFGAALLRRVLTFSGMPRRCREGACRRFKRCVGRDFRCQRDFPSPPLTEQEAAEIKAWTKRMLERRLGKGGGAGGAAGGAA